MPRGPPAVLAHELHHGNATQGPSEGEVVALNASRAHLTLQETPWVTVAKQQEVSLLSRTVTHELQAPLYVA